MKKTFILLLSLILAFILSSCEKASSSISSSSMTTTINDTKSQATTSNRYRENYEFTYFMNDNVSTESTITDGLVLVRNELHKTNGDLVVIYCLEVDLNKVTIVSGTNNNETLDFDYTKATPYQMAKSFEEDTNRKVYASINADFFGATCVNAFVKDGYIIKNAHTSTGVFDYLDTKSDVPASAPMLFGVKGTTAQVQPIRSYIGDITSADVKKKVVTSTLTYKISSNGTSINSSASLSFANKAITLDAGSTCLEVDLSEGVQNMKVVAFYELDERFKFPEPEENRGYVYSMNVNESEKAFIESIMLGDTISLSVKSATNTWNGYTEIIGCRQALIINSEIADTVTLENSNGAQNKDVPKSAVGIKDSNTVVIFACESLYYGKKASDGDSHGLSLPELAEFMHYYNIVDGANFDGGGSSQLIVRENDAFNKVLVRSSDTGSYNPDQSRKVMNSLLVVEKE